jgi:hypothetical protein
MHYPKHARMTAISMLGLATTANAQALAPNRALYVFEPSRVSQNGQATPTDGRIAYELTGNACKGYEVDSRVANIYADENGQKRVDLAAATFEAGDGKSFDVRQTQYVNTIAGPEEHVNVTRTEDGIGQGQIHGLKNVEFKLKPEVMFPSAFEKKLINLALKGEKRDVSFIFDGSDSEKVFRAITTIGPTIAPGTNAADKSNPAAAPLLSGNSWHFSISYFPAADDKAETPDYQTDFTMYENGVASDMLIDYGAYALKGTLAKLEMLPEEPCVPDANAGNAQSSTPR